MPYDDDEMAQLMAGQTPYQGGQFGGTGAGASWGESLVPGRPEERAGIMDIARGDVPLSEDYPMGGANADEVFKRNVLEPAQSWWEYTPREEKFMGLLNVGVDVADMALEGGAGAMGAGMFFGSKASRNEMAKALQTARKMYKPGTSARQGLLKTAERGIALGEKPATTWKASAQGAAGAFEKYAPESMMREAASQNLERIVKSRAAVRKELDDVNTRLMGSWEAKHLEMFKRRKATYQKAYDDLSDELRKHNKDLKRMETAIARNRAKYETSAELSRSYVTPGARGSGTEFHEVGVHGMVAGLDPVQKNLVEGVMDQTNVGKWMAKKHGMPMPGQPDVKYTFPEGWRDTPEEQLAWVLTEISEGRVPSQEAISTSQLDDLMRALEGNF